MTLVVSKPPCNRRLDRKKVCGMQIYTSYSVKIKHYNRIFKDTVSVYRHAVDYLINVCLKEWDSISAINGNLLQ